MPPLDQAILTINEFAVSTPWPHPPTAAYAKYGNLLFALFIVAALVAVAAQQVAVAMVSEARPDEVYPNILVLVSKTSDPSLLSDDACVAGAVAAGLLFVDRRLGFVASAAALLMGVSRVYAGAHWVLDVIAVRSRKSWRVCAEHGFAPFSHPHSYFSLATASGGPDGRPAHGLECNRRTQSRLWPLSNRVRR